MVINRNFALHVILMFKMKPSEANNWEKCEQIKLVELILYVHLHMNAVISGI